MHDFPLLLPIVYIFTWLIFFHIAHLLLPTPHEEQNKTTSICYALTAFKV